MAHSESNHPLMPSVLDRLLGEEPPTATELRRNRPKLIRRLKRSLQRDLEDLLNTRCRHGLLPDDLTELDTSLVTYGIPDLTGANVGSMGGRDEFLRIIEDGIRRFEPRLKQVSVVPLDKSKEPLDRVMRFRIEAVLVTEHDAEPVMFLSTVEPSSGDYHVETE